MSPSSIHGLPTEILVLIFDYGGHLCLHEEGLPFAVKASHVSRQWRDVALGTPFVWSGIPVHPSRPTLTDHYLARSENSPLDVYFHFKKQVKVGEALTHLLRHRRRWRNLYVDAGTGGVVFVVILSLKDAGSSLPILQHFELNFTGKPTTIGRLPEIFTDSTPPKLCSLTMRGTSFNMLSPVFRNATQLDLSFLPRDMGNPTFSTFNLLMSGLTNLTHLKLASVFPKLIEGVDYGSIELPLLHTLELIMHKEEDYVPLFFSIICAPTLHTLRFESKWSTTWDGFLSCVDITSATFANLQNLALTMTMSAMPDSVTVYPELFMGFPELKILSLSAFHDDLIMRVFLWPWMHICDVGDMNPLDDYERIVFYDFSNMAIWPNLELLVRRLWMS
ncbi:hypothetical protein BDY19DRAFT_26113 [Irpex rosettiformis]|uniref:Uncharacterized protein n=1 Tax=Irpex rosettiformis TaxID=378272 RepID=A0ACB8ULG2_9APHY|nr:hypothetical protein BDY19DRAFT_26113 [Irpex rosettiformis]